MSKAKELHTTTDLVKGILENCPETRNSDNILYLKVCEKIGNEHGINLASISVPHFFLHLKAYKLPQYETVGRARRKIQSEYPELSGDSTVTAQRMLNEEVFRDYAKGGV